MGYFMMLCSPISIDVLPLRLIALFIGASIVLAFNLLMKRNKQYKTSKGVIENLLKEISIAIDTKLEGGCVDASNFEVTKKFYLSIFNNLNYKVMATKRQEQLLKHCEIIRMCGYGLS